MVAMIRVVLSGQMPNVPLSVFVVVVGKLLRRFFSVNRIFRDSLHLSSFAGQ